MGNQSMDQSFLTDGNGLLNDLRQGGSVPQDGSHFPLGGRQMVYPLHPPIVNMQNPMYVGGYPQGFYPTDPSWVGNSMGPSSGLPHGGHMSLQYFSGGNYNSSML